MSFRGAVPPLLLILAATAGNLGCDTEARRQKRAEEARARQAWEDAQRREAETAPPTPEVLEQVRTAAGDFIGEHHPELLVEGQTLTPLTPNLFLVGVSVKDLLKGNTYVAQLTAERLRDGEWDGEFKENGRLLWVIDYASEARMKELALRHGFQGEVERIRYEDPERRHLASWGHRTWLDDYLLWHLLFHRPVSYGWRGGAFSPLAPGFRASDPGRPVTEQDAARFRGAAAPTGGRSMVFLGGSAWRPPTVGSVQGLPGQAFVAGPRGSISGKAPIGAVGRGGFGHAGHVSGTGG
ncbi:hypothetical protein [Mesoterricola sediminis]|uniref:Uncharacterized protein n=1 Tax=Mesoterricola sediminis TaxID=2927980 RepID=A0AA48GPY7_9BACT|nr:hypothetical protein [Mesoterricola sediminis]BDU75414.1 hypothetical protein METESE_03720 [Mesoterricola sediminis]